jgi:hypothetical protein
MHLAACACLLCTHSCPPPLCVPHLAACCCYAHRSSNRSRSPTLYVRRVARYCCTRHSPHRASSCSRPPPLCRELLLRAPLTQLLALASSVCCCYARRSPCCTPSRSLPLLCAPSRLCLPPLCTLCRTLLLLTSISSVCVSLRHVVRLAPTRQPLSSMHACCRRQLEKR